MLNTSFPFTLEVYKFQRMQFFLISCQRKKKERMLILYCMFFLDWIATIIVENLIRGEHILLSL